MENYEKQMTYEQELKRDKKLVYAVMAIAGFAVVAFKITVLLG